MRDPATGVIESPAEFEQAYLLVVPIDWEQNRAEVKMAITYHRYACFKLRQLARVQGAIDWSATVEKRVWEWSRSVGTWVFRLMLGLPR